MPNSDTEESMVPTDDPSRDKPEVKQYQSMLKRVGGGALVVLGFILSPISWWNDLLINIPLAYLFAAATTWAQPVWFNGAFVIGYLLTNVIGMVLLQYGMKHAARASKPIDFRKELKSSLSWSVAYTALIVVLLLIGWIKPPVEYLR